MLTPARKATSTYEPPQAMRLGEVRNGTGDCWSSGSGDASWCYISGNGATGGNGCEGAGNLATGVCWYSGISPGVIGGQACDGSGSQAAAVCSSNGISPAGACTFHGDGVLQY